MREEKWVILETGSTNIERMNESTRLGDSPFIDSLPIR